MNTNKYLGGLIVVAWLLLIVDFIGDRLIPPIEPVVTTVSAESAPVDKSPVKMVASEQPLKVLLASASMDRGKKVAKKCVSCHTFEKNGKNKVGPNLYNIFGKTRGVVSGFAYSSAIKTMGGKWGFEDMNQFLVKPKKFMPGTKMSFSGLKKSGDRAALLLYLRSFADSPATLP